MPIPSIVNIRKCPEENYAKASFEEGTCSTTSSTDKSSQSDSSLHFSSSTTPSAQKTRSISFGQYRDNGAIPVEHTLGEYKGHLYIEAMERRLNEKKHVNKLSSYSEDEDDDDATDASSTMTDLHEEMTVTTAEPPILEELLLGRLIDHEFSCFGLLDLSDDDLELPYRNDISAMQNTLLDAEDNFLVEPKEPTGTKFASANHRRTEVRGLQNCSESPIELVHLEKRSRLPASVSEEGPLLRGSEPSGAKLSENDVTDRRNTEVQGYTNENKKKSCHEDSVELVHLEQILPEIHEDEYGAQTEQEKDIQDEVSESKIIFDDEFGSVGSPEEVADVVESEETEELVGEDASQDELAVVGDEMSLTSEDSDLD